MYQGQQNLPAGRLALREIPELLLQRVAFIRQPGLGTCARVTSNHFLRQNCHYHYVCLCCCC